MKKLLALLVLFSFFGTFLATSVLAAESGWEKRQWTRSTIWNPVEVKMTDCKRFKKDPPYVVGFSNASVSNSWAALTPLEFKTRCEKHKDLIKNYYITDAEDKPNKQISDIEDLVSKGVDLLVVRACSEAALDPIITKLHKEGIPVIMFARRIKSDNFVSFVSASFIAQGRLQAIWLFQMLGGKGNVVLLGGRAGAGSTEQRKRAYYEVAQSYPDINILDFQYTGYSPAKAKKIMAAWIQSYGKDKIHGVLNGGLQGAGALEAMHEAGMKVPITGEPSNGVLKRVQKWGFPGMVVSSPPALAGDCVDVGLKVLQGVNVPFLNETKRYISSTVDTADIKSDVPWDKITRMDKDDNWWDNFVDPKYLP